jgi:hypothetical protein
MIRLSNELIDQRLIGRNIKRLDDYINSATPIRFLCLVKECNHIWRARPNGISSGRGCPECAHRIRRIKNMARRPSNEEIDQALLQKKIKRLDEYVNARTKILFVCLICEYEWMARPFNILSAKCDSGCPKCAGNARMTNEEIDKRLIGRNIKRIGSYAKNSDEKIKFQCLNPKCNHIWMVSPNAILNNDSGCPGCAYQTVSKSETKWLDSKRISDKNRTKILMIDGKRYNVDAYISRSKTVYEFYGDYWHGNLDIYAADKQHPMFKMTFGDLYKKTINREAELVAAGYKVISIWEYDWKEQQKKKSSKRDIK